VKKLWIIGGRNGFTLIEAMIASIIVAGIILGTGAILYRSVHIQHDSERYSYANNLAREKIEQLKNLGYSGITAGTTTTTSANGQFNVITTITNDLDHLGRPLRTKTITVQVTELTGAQQVLATHSTTIFIRGV
jgi:prepilin-type N-terminal cleavage/methylation domain-containing protein